MNIDFNDKRPTGHIDTYILKDTKNLSHREDKSKKINVFVPLSYDSTLPHSVLYFFDSQNLFCGAGHYTENADPYGGWKLDVVLRELQERCGKNIIVVGMDNADKYRDLELFPDPSKFGELAPLATALPDEDYSRGVLENLHAFILDTLHPFIKEHYRIDDSNIGIGGASMGGIASFWCGLDKLGFYSYVLSYSPAYGLYDMSAFENWFEKLCFAENREKLPKIHIYCGENDPLERLLISSAKQMKVLLVKHGYDENKIFETYVKENSHNEEAWRSILPQSFEYLL